jgi:tRNA 2-thiouridine synthesizing protein A
MTDPVSAEPSPVAAEVDAAGLLCPLPVLRARKRLLSLAPGEVLRLVATDPAAIVDVPHFCAEAGHTLLGVADTGTGAQAYLIRRG